jgi:hypothetical protein
VKCLSDQGTLTERVRLTTVDFLAKIACFIKKKKISLKAADLSSLVQGGQLY